MTGTNGEGAALRAKRYRRHKAGDHSLCSVDRCRAARDLRDVAAVVPEGGMSVVTAVTETVAALSFPEGDARLTLAAIALQLAEAFDAAPSAALAREIRVCVNEIVDRPNEAPGVIAEIQAKRMARRVDWILRSAEEESR